MTAQQYSTAIHMDLADKQHMTSRAMLAAPQTRNLAVEDTACYMHKVDSLAACCAPQPASQWTNQAALQEPSMGAAK